MQVVIVESPAKAKTIEKYLGPGFKVLASYGHIRDLPPKDGSVDPDNGFAMQWELYGDKAKQLKAIADASKGADRIILATDPDREGEAIAWHLLEWLKGRKAVPKGGTARVTFNAITKATVLAAMAAPRELDDALIDAYKARRALDYLVGFTLSPVLWRKLPGAKSAGRVQSVALRIVVDREREIEAFRAREYWTVQAVFAAASGATFTARLNYFHGKRIDKFDLNNEQDAHRARAEVEAGRFTVSAVETKPVTRNPYPPFTTSTLQQEASRKLGFTASHTMRVAQGLYEEGHITYMRTDGVQIGAESIAVIRDVIAKEFGRDALPEKARHYATKAKNAQEAHEAIRPTEPSNRHAGGADAAKLYDLIWKRTIASQMASARLERTSVDLLSDDGRTGLRASGQVVIFEGFMAVYNESRDEAPVDDDEDDGKRLPRLTQGETPVVNDVSADQHFTEPPPRFSEATLVKKLEELGIGRPSTYASILQTLRDRSYVRIEKNRFFAEEKGRLVTAFLERFFEKYVGYDFTAELETELDEVSAGSLDYLTVLGRFWTEFEARTKDMLDMRPSDVTVALDEFLAPLLFPPKDDGSDPRLCTTCGTGRLSLKTGKFGAFIACSNYPECRYTRQFAGDPAEASVNGGAPLLLGVDPATGEPVSLRSGRFGVYVQLGEDGAKDAPKPPRASIPKDVTVAGPDDLEMALRLLALPREVGIHPETQEKILASIGRYGPYLQHNGKYARLTSTAEVFETGMNAAVVKLAEALAAGPRARNSPAPLREVGLHPVSGAPIRLIAGRFGQYLADGTTNATVPKDSDGMALTLDEAVALLDARAAMPAKGKKKPVKKAVAKKAPAKKAAAKPAAKTVKKVPADADE